MKFIVKIKCLLIAVLFITGSFQLSSQGFENFITASGNKLMDGNREYRFLTYNIPNLNFIEDEMSFTTISPFRLPTEFEIRDALMSIKQMGGRAVRLYTIPVKRQEQSDNVPAHVLAPGVFNEEAFKVNDMMLSLANEIGIRIIFPIVNNHKWMGGRPQYAGFRGKTPDEFWTDSLVIEDVKKTIEYTLNRTNTITGVKYKDDKSILCWETGNELRSTPEWTITITRYIKSIDKNHLVMDGYNAIDNINYIMEYALNEPSIDIVTSHHYETDPKATIDNIIKNIEIVKGRKPYLVGEFGFQSTVALEQTMDWMIANKNIIGGLVWSLRSHREEGGFYWHSEPFGYGLYKAYHWPGFSSGHAYDEIQFNELMRHKAFKIQGLVAPPVQKPLSPKLLTIDNVYNINWQGSAGASYYNVERSEKPNGEWNTIAVNISDADVQYTSLYHDKTAIIGKSYYYRVIAGNVAGLSDPSNVVGPVTVSNQALIDDMSNFGMLYNSSDIFMKKGDDRKFKEDICRMEGKQNSELIYFVPGKFIGIKVYAFQKIEEPVLSFKISENLTDYMDAAFKYNDFYEGSNDYGSWHPLVYEYTGNNTGIRYIKILFKEVVQISRIEITYK